MISPLLSSCVWDPVKHVTNSSYYVTQWVQSEAKKMKMNIIRLGEMRKTIIEMKGRAIQYIKQEQNGCTLCKLDAVYLFRIRWRQLCFCLAVLGRISAQRDRARPPLHARGDAVDWYEEERRSGMKMRGDAVDWYEDEKWIGLVWRWEEMQWFTMKMRWEVDW